MVVVVVSAGVDTLSLPPPPHPADITATSVVRASAAVRISIAHESTTAHCESPEHENIRS